MDKINFGILGAGKAAATIHLPALKDDPRVELVAIASRSPENAGRLADQFSIHRVCKTYQDLLADPEIEAVVICTPPHQHREQAQSAFENGKHVLIEKPIATTLSDVAALKSIACQSTLVIDVVRNQRFQDLYRCVKTHLNSGIIGEPNYLFFSSTTLGPEVWNAASSWFRDPIQAGGGSLIDLGVHKADLAAWLLESAPSRVHPAMVDKTPLEDIGCLQMELGEVMVNILASWRGPEEGAQVLAFGSHGSLRASGSTGEVEIRLANEVRHEKVCIPWSEEDRSAELMIADFIGRCLKAQGFNEKELEIWDAGTRTVLEAYLYATMADRLLREEAKNV